MTAIPNENAPRELALSKRGKTSLAGRHPHSNGDESEGNRFALIAEIESELAQELGAALYVVGTPEEVHVLAEVGLRSAVATQTAQLDHAISATVERAASVIIAGCDVVAVSRHIRTREPAATIRILPLPDTASSVLGLLGLEPRFALRSIPKNTASLHRGALFDYARTRIQPGDPDVRPASTPTSCHGSWPNPLDDSIRLGLVGEFLEAVEEETEADPAAMVFDLMTRVGNAAGHGPHFTISGDRHGTNLFTLIVGNTAQGRKGTSAVYPKAVMAEADAHWATRRVQSGLSTGEGIIWALRDANETGKGQSDPGVADKRLLVVETELARTLRASRRKDSVLMPILRQSWEGSHLATLTKAPYVASNPHVSLIAHVTPQELLALMSETEISAGTMNRFLFVASRRQRELPFGGEVSPETIARIGARLSNCLRKARNASSEISFSAAAREAWPRIYRELQVIEGKPGLYGALLGRTTVQVRRLAMIFAICDERGEVDLPHVLAARQLWRYVQDSIAYVFGQKTGDRVADRIIDELRCTQDGLARAEISNLLSRHATAGTIQRALDLLAGMGLAQRRCVRTDGRPKEVWMATKETSQWSAP